MALEILFSVATIMFAGYILVYINNSIAETVYTDPLGAAFWPRFLLIALIVLLGVNLVQIYRRTPPDKRNLGSITKLDIENLLKNRLVWGILLLVVYAYLLPITGFLLTSFVMGILLSYLLGEKRVHILIVSSMLTVVVIFVVFFSGMSIQLPRGSVPFLRNFALTVETFLRHLV